jgi:uncharacterized protein with HEPN domain
MVEAIAQVQEYVRGQSFEQFCADPKTVDAVIARLAVLGEAARHVPDPVRDAHPEVPWRKMQALRNVVVHEYDRIDLGLLWGVVQRDLPPLVPLLESIHDREPGE